MKIQIAPKIIDINSYITPTDDRVIFLPDTYVSDGDEQGTSEQFLKLIAHLPKKEREQKIQERLNAQSIDNEIRSMVQKDTSFGVTIQCVGSLFAEKELYHHIVKSNGNFDRAMLRPSLVNNDGSFVKGIADTILINGVSLFVCRMDAFVGIIKHQTAPVISFEEYREQQLVKSQLEKQSAGNNLLALPN